MGDYGQNFTQPGTPGGGMERPRGTGDNGETWDPVTKRWIKQSEMPAQYNPAAGQNPVDEYGNPLKSNQDAGRKGLTNPGAPATPGRVEFNTSGDGYNSGGTWGGYIGTNVIGPDGKVYFDGSLSGRAADERRLKGLGEAAANRTAYQNDYSQAEHDAQLGAGARQSQGSAIHLARDVAMGGETHAMKLQRNMLQQGAQTQQAAAMSTRGGALAQAAAMRQQQNGQAGYMQQGNTQIQALQADEMAAARQQYQQMATQRRQQDAQAQGLHQDQAAHQMANEIGQRELNQQGQMGYEGMLQNVNKAAQDAVLKNRETQVGIDAAASLRSQRLADRDLATAGNIAATGGTLVAGLSQIGDGDEDEKKKDDDPWATSDERAKRAVRPMSLGEAAARRGY